METKYPDICVSLVGEDSNVFNLLGIVSGAMKMAKVDKPEIDTFFKEAMSGNYDHALKTIMDWVTVE
jgi:hypothetical protein